MKEYKTSLFIIYWGRWMFSAIVMLPFMLLFEYYHIQLWINLILGQTIGSIIFFKIDKRIFKGNEAKTIKEEYNTTIEAIHEISNH